MKAKGKRAAIMISNFTDEYYGLRAMSKSKYMKTQQKK